VGDKEKSDQARQCPTCKAGFSADMRFCPQDGTPLADVQVPDNGQAKRKKKANSKSKIDESSSAEPEVKISEKNSDRESLPPSNGTGLEEDLNLEETADPSQGSVTKTLTTTGNRPAPNLTDPRLELLGQIVEDRYEVTETLGKGGMSVVFKARDRRLKKIVALKVLMPHLSVDPLSVQRFHQEATAASHLDHPNIVKVYNVGTTESGLPFMAMDYLEGTPLSSIIKEKGKLYFSEALNIFIQLTGALAHAHEKGVIHRDLKPSNVILSSQGEETDVAKLVDFGIAKVLSQDGQTQAKLTQTGDVFGSPHYMSPEQCLGGELDERSDVYSMGCLMYETLTGRPPHTGESTLQILHKHISETPASFKSLIPESNISAELESIVFKCLAPKRDDRVQSMRQLKAELGKLYMIREKNTLDQALAQLSLAWAKRPKLSKREKAVAVSGLVVSIVVLGLAWFSISFFDVTNNSAWLNPSIVSWVPPKQQTTADEDKVSLAFTQVDMYIKKRDDLIADGVVKPGEIVRSLTHAGLELQKAGRLDDAAAALDAASEVAAKYISKYSTSYANLLFYKGRVYYQLEKYAKAISNLKECIESSEWPASHLWKGDCESILGDCYNFTGDRNNAEIYYERALGRWKHNHCDAPRFPITAARYGDLIIPYNTQQSFRVAYDLFKTARDKWRVLADNDRQNIALCDLRISQILTSVGKKETAFLHLQEADQELLLAFGRDNPKRANVMMKLADALWDNGKRMEALKERYDCWLILRNAPPPAKARSLDG